MELEDLLQVAWKRIKVDRKTDFLIGNFEYVVYEKFKEELVKHVAEKFKREGKDYRPEPLRKIRVPKSSHTTRPGAVPTIDDRIIYQYLVDEIAEQVEPNLIPIEDGVVHSYRYALDRNSEISHRGTLQPPTPCKSGMGSLLEGWKLPKRARDILNATEAPVGERSERHRNQ